VYVCERLEAKRVFYQCGVGRRAVNGTALDEKAVADMLEFPEHLAFRGALEPHYAPRETDVFAVGACQAPLSEQVASLPSFLARDNQQERK
jgi:hypothetical protein